MSSIFTEGYLESITVTSAGKSLKSNIKNILIVPPKDNTQKITLDIYEYDKYHPIYEVHFLNQPISINNLKKDMIYTVKTDSQKSVQLYYEKEDNK